MTSGATQDASRCNHGGIAGAGDRADRRQAGEASVEGRIAAGVRLVPENRELFSTMTVADNLLVVDVADEAYVMELGESKLSGTVVAVAANPDVVTSYLGFASA